MRHLRPIGGPVGGRAGTMHGASALPKNHSKTMGSCGTAKPFLVAARGSPVGSAPARRPGCRWDRSRCGSSYIFFTGAGFSGLGAKNRRRRTEGLPPAGELSYRTCLTRMPAAIHRSRSHGHRNHGSRRRVLLLADHHRLIGCNRAGSCRPVRAKRAVPADRLFFMPLFAPPRLGNGGRAGRREWSIRGDGRLQPGMGRRDQLQRLHDRADGPHGGRPVCRRAVVPAPFPVPPAASCKRAQACSRWRPVPRSFAKCKWADDFPGRVAFRFAKMQMNAVAPWPARWSGQRGGEDARPPSPAVAAPARHAGTVGRRRRTGRPPPSACPVPRRRPAGPAHRRRSGRSPPPPLRPPSLRSPSSMSRSRAARGRSSAPAGAASAGSRNSRSPRPTASPV